MISRLAESTAQLNRELFEVIYTRIVGISLIDKRDLGTTRARAAQSCRTVGSTLAHTSAAEWLRARRYAHIRVHSNNVPASSLEGGTYEWT